MSNISKNLLLGLTLVCVIILIVFCIQLIVLNRGADPAGSGPAISSGSQSGEEPGSEGEGEEEPNGESGEGSNVNAPPTPRPPPQGTRHTLNVTQQSQLIIYASEELFDFEERELDWWFLYTGGGVATLEISYIVITAQGVAAHAESFLNNYTGGTEAEFTGEESIRGSELRGYHVSAMHGGEMYEAWIHTLLDSDMALVFVINYERDQQREALYEILSTLDMIGRSDPGTGTADTPVPDGNDDDDDEPDPGDDT